MKIRQKTIKALELYVDDVDKFEQYLNKNIDFLKKFLVIIYGEIDENVENLLKQNSILYQRKDVFQNHSEIFRKNSNEKSLNQLLKPKKDKDRVVFNRPIRSGEEVNLNKDITIFGRINSASRVFSNQNIEIFGEINGTVICNGTYLIIKNINNGIVMFHDYLIDKNKYPNELKKISLENNQLSIRKL
jgi:septum site-determining protein MinC